MRPLTIMLSPDSGDSRPRRDDEKCGFRFAIRATATISIATAGTYIFGVKSNGGSRLRIDTGAGFVTVINDDAIHMPSDRFGTATFAAAGQYALDLVYFNGFGTGEFELFAASGTYTPFNPSAFRLVGLVRVIGYARRRHLARA